MEETQRGPWAVVTITPCAGDDGPSWYAAYHILMTASGEKLVPPSELAACLRDLAELLDDEERPT